MASAQSGQRHVSLEAENVGGIEQTQVEFEPGVTILVGRNATHRTSLLQAIMAGLGSRRASLKGDAEAGRVHLQTSEGSYTRRLQRRENGVSFEGDPYLDDPTLADLFAFLLESNETRRTVARGGDLREIIMAPVDAESIEADIERLETEKRHLEAQIDDLESLQGELSALESERTRLETEIRDREEQLARKRQVLDEQSTDSPATEREQSQLEAKMSELQQARSTLEQTEFRLDSQRESLETLREELTDLEDEQSDLSGESSRDLQAVTDEISRLQERKQALDSELTRLQSVIQFNEEMIEGTSQDIASTLRGDAIDESVTDQLLDPTEAVVCWTCGTEVDQERIEETLRRLRDLRETKYGEQSDIEAQLETLKQRRSEIESRREQRKQVADQIEDVRAEIEQREAKITELEADRTDLEAEVETLNAEITELEQQERSEAVEIHKEINELEIELDRLEDERDRVASNIEEIESHVAEIEALEAEKAEINSELTDLRTRIDRIEREAIEAFNEHMETVLDILGYTNLDRIWVERTGEGADVSTFDLHVVRRTDDGVSYEDDFQHLSESEREVTGLVFALAGYLVHDVYETVPFVLLDSLEAIDSERIAKLVEYIAEYVEYLVVALLPEDAAALDDSYRRIENI